MGGRRIDDHSFWAGKGDNMNVCPKEAKQMKIDDVYGAGDLENYQDTEQKIRSAQNMTVSKVKKYKQDPEYRY